MMRLNPYAAAQKKSAQIVENARKADKQARLDAKRGVSILSILHPTLY